MKQVFITAKVTLDLTIPAKELVKIPKKVGIITTVQHMHQIKDIQKQLKGSVIAGQILGCNAAVASRVDKKVDAYLYVGGGIFHPIALGITTKKKVYKYHPILKKVSRLTQKEIDDYQRKKQVSLVKFLSAKKVGILVSVKPGQEHITIAKQLAKHDDDREYFLFAFDTLNPINMEDFNFIDMWVDTACPRIADEKTNIIDIHEVIKVLKMKTGQLQRFKQF